MKKQVLWISFRVPYDAVRHAGGKIHNYYLKALHGAGDCEIRLLSFVKPDDEGKVDLDAYGIRNDLIHYRRGKLHRLFWAGMRRLTVPLQWGKNGGATTLFEDLSMGRKIRALAETGYQPQVVILQWTQMVLFAPLVRRLFPQAKLIAIEEDVLFLNYRRRAEGTAAGVKKWIASQSYERLKRSELESLKLCDLTILNNPKDEKLVQQEGVTSTWYWTPYFQSMLDCARQLPNQDVLFYGAMYREENWRSALWLIEKVFPKITDPRIRLCIIGHNPPQILQKYRSDRIIIEGYVEDLTKYFKESLCLAAPLVLGAGVKIKVIEGLSAGIPVLTNDIGIEGIPAVNGREYYHCETPEEYVAAIESLAANRADYRQQEAYAKDFIRTTYDMKRDAGRFTRIVKEI